MQNYMVNKIDLNTEEFWAANMWPHHLIML